MNRFTTAKFITPEHDSIRAIGEDGSEFFVPVDPGNKDYRVITEGDESAGVKPLVIEPCDPQDTA